MTWTGALLALGGPALAAGVFRLLQRRVPPAVLATVLLLPVLWILADESWRIHSHHGLLHASIVYAIHDRGAPPENPLLAGEGLGYPFGHHFVLAHLMDWIPVAPPWLFAATNVLCLGLVAVLLARAARLLSLGPAARVLVILLALYGSNPFSLGVPISVLQRLGLQTETRLAPLLKFMTVNSSPLGILFLAVTLYGLALLFRREPARPAAFSWIVLGVVGAGVLYPVAWWSVVACVVAAAVVLAASGGGVRAARIPIGALLLGALPLVPWFLLLGADRASPAYPELLLSPRHLLRNGSVVLLAAALPVLLLARAKGPGIPRDAGRWLAVTVAFLALAFGASHLAIHSEYWLPMGAQLPLALVLAEPLRRLLAERPLVGLVVLAALLAPVAWFLSAKLSTDWTVADPATTAGRELRHRVPEQRALHDWIARNTEANAVLLDSHLCLPAFARRPLFVGLDGTRELDVDSNGVGLSALRWLRNVQGRDPLLLERRAGAARTILDPRAAGDLDRALATVRSEIPDRPVWIVARASRARARLAEAGLERAFRNAAAAVYRLP